MLAGHVAELSDWGVSSLKIEGRMKRPEYAAIVTKVYSDLLREHRRPTAEERDILRRVFSRDGFIRRLLHRQAGRQHVRHQDRCADERGKETL